MARIRKDANAPEPFGTTTHTNNIWEKCRPLKMAGMSFYVVFLLPVVLSVIFGGSVLALQDGGDIVLFGPPKVTIIGLQEEYGASESVIVRIEAAAEYDCGDLYVTITQQGSGEVISQAGFFDQCFADSDSLLPVGDEFSEVIGEPGRYILKVDISSTSQSPASASGSFTIK